MKKVVSLLLAVVLVCSMATVAFAAIENTCSVCGFTSSNLVEFTNHKNSKACAKCPYCGDTGCENADELAYHTYECKYANIVCDYCGENHESEKDYAEHIADCKAHHFYVPLAKIIADLKAYIGKIDFKKAFNGAKDFVTGAIPYVKDFASGIGSIAK